ncbi:hypothetical protein BZY94_05150 [Burkholderia territorii]|nr:hypothetical protein BZY94_05150 [Burkholderia territorii]
MVETRQGKRRGSRTVKGAYPASDTLAIKTVPARVSGAAKSAAIVGLSYGRFIERLRKKAPGKVVIATFPDESTQERLAELERRVGLLTRFGSSVDLLKAVELGTVKITDPDVFCVFVENQRAHATTSSKLDGPLDLSRMTLPAIDPESLSEQRREAIHHRFQGRKK